MDSFYSGSASGYFEEFGEGSGESMGESPGGYGERVNYDEAGERMRSKRTPGKVYGGGDNEEVDSLYGSGFGGVMNNPYANVPGFGIAMGGVGGSGGASADAAGSIPQKESDTIKKLLEEVERLRSKGGSSADKAKPGSKKPRSPGSKTRGKGTNTTTAKSRSPKKKSPRGRITKRSRSPVKIRSVSKKQYDTERSRSPVKIRSVSKKQYDTERQLSSILSQAIEKTRAK